MSDSKNLNDRCVGLLRWCSFLFIPATLLSCIVCLAKQSGQSAQANQSSSDAFLGTWRFNPDKSSRAGLESKSVVIESQGNGYKLTIDYVRENGVKWHLSATTSMKGEVAKTYDIGGKQTTQDWRVTRDGPRSFLLESLGSYGRQEKYEVTVDGKTMTMHDVTVNPRIIAGKIDKNGKLVRVDTTEVFDRVLPTPSK